MQKIIIILLLTVLGLLVGCVNTSSLETQIADLQKQLKANSSTLEDLQNQYTSERETWNSERLDYQSELAAKDGRIIELEQEVADEDKKTAEQAEQIVNLEEQIKSQSSRITDLENQIAAKEIIPATFTITTSDDLAYYLIVNYGLCETSLGRTYFTFYILENDSSSRPYDFWIQVEYDSGFFYDLKYSKDITTEKNRKVCEELKNHQEKLAKAVIELMPNKKFYGGYYDSWYRYPELKLDLITRHYYSWVNYTPASGSADYNEAKVSQFQWYTLIDDELIR